MSDLMVQNARIEFVRIGVPHTEHGCLSFSIGVEYDGGGQGYGGLVLDTYDEAKKMRVPTILASSLLMAVNEVWGLDWEDLKGIPCRTYHDWNHIVAVGHFFKDKWMWFSQDGMEFKTGVLSDMVRECK
jgi:hypothetical protein